MPVTSLLSYLSSGMTVEEILEGALKTSKLKLVQAWIEIHQDELMANWELASQGQSVFKIEPLR